jgi:hypothetical protein
MVPIRLNEQAGCSSSHALRVFVAEDFKSCPFLRSPGLWLYGVFETPVLTRSKTKMIPEGFRASLSHNAPPHQLSALLVALWWDAKGDGPPRGL